MKKALLIFSLIITSISFSQTVTGHWQGILTHPNDTAGFTDNYAFYLNIEQEGNDITGMSRIELANSKNFSVMLFKGTFQHGQLSLTETDWDESYMQEGMYINWCLKRATLIYTWEDSTESLRGIWSSSPECGPGEIYVHRSPKEFNRRTAQHHNYITFSELKKRMKNGESVLNQKVILPEVTFEANQSKILPGSRPILKELKELMDTHPNLKIDILGHTGNLGNDQFNLTLSLQRAKTVKDYLAKMGISESRLQYHGFGESRPVADNGTEDGRSKNRRIEFEIVAE
ncbi:MAG: OmpA family protein [Crocinitomicaceae bacterium]|nr:OmpA family protein [Crocinitomicaceae bacterium]